VIIAMIPKTTLHFLMLALVFGAAVSPSGCGRSTSFDKSTQYTPETLAQELAFRYNALSPVGKTPMKTRRPQKSQKAVDSKADEQSTTKAQSKAATKKERPKSVDDVLDDIEAKAGLVPGMSRAEVLAKMAEAIGKDGTLDDGARRALVEKLKEAGGG
jgi:hypothetical protein